MTAEHIESVPVTFKDYLDAKLSNYPTKDDLRGVENRLTWLIPTITGVVIAVLGLIDKYLVH
jgi:hypothetical protein